MKKRFFKFIEIDKDIVEAFCKRHPTMSPFINLNIPFYVRVGLKLYPTLIHTIICDNEQNGSEVVKLNQFAILVNGKIDPKRVNKLSLEQLTSVLGKDKALLVQAITRDVLSKKLNLKKLSKSSEIEIDNALKVYPNITINAIKTFTLFGCFKQNVLLKEEPDFINGLKIYLKKDNILKEDIDNISNEYKNELTIFSLCMFRINNEKAGK